MLRFNLKHNFEKEFEENQIKEENCKCQVYLKEEFSLTIKRQNSKGDVIVDRTY